MDKGASMEETLRTFFLNQGFFVVRGLKYRFHNNDVTDVDLYLYKRVSSLTRQRINVDIKNKKSPQALERILWANGLKTLLKFDECIVATTDERPYLREFGSLHNTQILDNKFLQNLKQFAAEDRISEEDLMLELGQIQSYNTFKRDWRFIYEESKSRLLSAHDYSGFNETVNLIQYLLKKVVLHGSKRPIVYRILYAAISHLLIIADYILKDLVLLDEKKRKEELAEGFRFGNLGKDGINKIISIAKSISGKSSTGITRSLQELPVEILAEFFGKGETIRNIFVWALAFEKHAFATNLLTPIDLDPHLRGVIAVLLDFSNVGRNTFFDPSHKTNIEAQQPDNPSDNQGASEQRQENKQQSLFRSDSDESQGGRIPTD